MSPLVAVDLITFAVLVIAWALAPVRPTRKTLTVGQATTPSLVTDSSAA